MSTNTFPITTEFECTVMTYNLWGLPVWVPGSNQRKRFRQIADHVSTLEENIICLQETFSKKLRQQLLPKVKEHFHLFSDYSKSKKIAGLVPIDQKGGLMTLSKYPILEEQFFEYPLNKKMRWEERVARKGFIWSKIKTPCGMLNVLNTHLYASGNSPSEKQRLLQIQHLKKIIDAIPDFYNHPTILMGDINICHPDIHQKYPHRPKSLVYEFLQTEMNFVDTMPEICEEDCTINCRRNHYVPEKNDLQKLDYCFLYVPKNYNYEILQQKTLFGGAAAMSDHLAWVTRMKWKQENVKKEVSAEQDVTRIRL